MGWKNKGGQRGKGSQLWLGLREELESVLERSIDVMAVGLNIELKGKTKGQEITYKDIIYYISTHLTYQVLQPACFSRIAPGTCIDARAGDGTTDR